MTSQIKGRTAVNLPNNLVERVDAVVGNVDFGAHESRAEFVRTAVSLYLSSRANAVKQASLAEELQRAVSGEDPKMAEALDHFANERLRILMASLPPAEFLKLLQGAQDDASYLGPKP